MRNVVVLPQPLEPSNVKNSPFGDLEIDVIDRDHAVKGFIEVLNAQKAHGSFLSRVKRSLQMMEDRR